MGRVYLGESRTGRRVAIKVVREELAEDPAFRRRFAREVAAARAVSPLYTAAVVDADPDAAAPWLATTYIEGPTLTELVLTRGPLSLRAVLTLAAGLADALASIHRVGLVHRDLKPSNVIINNVGPHIIDFGIALAAETTGRLTTSKVLGTPSYIAPEIIQGGEPTSAGDVFSLGAALVFASSGKHLVGSGTVFAQILQITTGQFDLEMVPTQLRPLIVRCLSAEPKDRPTADEIALILVASGVSSPTPGWYGSPEPATAVLADADPKTGGRVTRRRVLALGGLVGAVAVGSAVAAAVGVQRRSGSPDARSPSTAPLSVVGPTSPATPPPTGPGSVRWDGASGAKAAGVSPGAQQPGARIIVDARKIIVTSNGSDVFAVDPDGHRRWTQTQTLPTAVNLRPWGDAVLVTDSKTLWLINAATGATVFSHNVAAQEETAARGDNADNLAIEIGAIALSTDLAFVGLGTATVAIDRQGKRVWRIPRAARQAGLRPSAGSPQAANETWLLVQDVANSVVRVSLRDVSRGERTWVVSYNQGPLTNVPGGPPPGPSGAPRGEVEGGPVGAPAVDSWSLFEARFGAGYVALRDSRALRVLALADGRTAWQQVSDKPIAGIEVIGDLLVVAADRLTGYALDRDVQRWQLDLRGVRLAPTPDGKRIVVASETEILLLDLAGTVVWRAPLPATVSGLAPERFTTDDHTAYLTFRPRPEQRGFSGVDVLAIALD